MSVEMNIESVSESIDQSLLKEQSDVQTKVGHVAKFNQDENEEFIYSKKEKKEFVGLTKEELKSYINNPKWKRIRWIISIIYILIVLFLLIGSIILIIFSSRCPPKAKLVWYEKEIIYEIDVPTFFDTNEDAIGDIKGIQQKFKYFEINQIKSILLRSSIFNVTYGRSIQLNGQIIPNKKVDLLTIDSLVGNENDLLDLIKILNRKDMHLIIDLPLSSTFDPNGYYWYGDEKQLLNKINNPCIENFSNLGCQYYQFYGQLPLDFNNQFILNKSKSLIEYWLLNQKFDGIRVNLPLIYNSKSNLYNISYETIEQWEKIKLNIEKKSKPKLLIIDLPFSLQNQIKNQELHNKIAYSLLLNNQQITNINGQILDQTFKNNYLSKPLFWQLGSKRKSDEIGIIDEKNLSKEMILTMLMLVGGTPIILYGEEIGLNQRINPLMAWTSESISRGFTSCLSFKCKQILSLYQNNQSQTNVKREEALGGQSKDSLLKLFRYLSKVRQFESFQFGLFESGYNKELNLFWFIRESSGYQGFIVLFNLKDELSHISLYELTKHNVPLNIHYEYQWPKSYFEKSNLINSDNLFIHPQSINMFSWKPKMIKPNILSKIIKEHS